MYVDIIYLLYLLYFVKSHLDTVNFVNTFPTMLYIQRYKGNAIPISPSPILLYNLVPLSAKHNYRRIISSQ